MKPITAILFSMFLFAFLFAGCAGSQVRNKETPVADDQVRYEVVTTPFGDIKREVRQTDADTAEAVAERSGLEPEEGFEIISTPFGYIKRKKLPDSPDASAVAEAALPQEALSQPGIESKSVLAAEPVKIPEPVKTPPAAEEISASEPVKKEAPAKTGDISFDFDEAELASVIRVMADFLEINYIIDPGVGGKVTIHTAGQLNAADVFPVFYQTLEVNGLTAIKEGNVYRITTLKDASRQPLTTRLAGDRKKIPPEERIVLQIIPLKYISAEEVTKVITPFISADGTIISEGNSNALLVVDKGINILKILKLVAAFDVSVFERTNYRFYTLENANAEDVSKTLGEILPQSSGGNGQVRFIPIKWLNAVLIVSSSDDVFDRADSLIDQLDVPGEGSQPQIYVYSVKNGMASDLGDTLRAIFGATGQNIQADQRENVATNPFARDVANSKKETGEAEPNTATVSTARPAATPSDPSATLRGDIRITDDQIRNALIIEALPGDYKVVERLLERLDILPRQVLIDVTIAEVSLGEGTELGIEWTFKKDDWSEEGSLSALIGGTGLQYVLGLSEKWQAALHALADDSKLNIISTPSVLASDNKQAKIDVTTEVPIPSTSYTYVNEGDNLLETSVEYRDTGVILEVTPHINEYGLVTMDISQEVSNVGALVKVAGEDYYSFDRKKILTSLTVKHNQSIVIGGLISNERKNASSGVPWLTKVPLIRWFTGTEKNEASRSELIVMITPHVITSLEDVDTISREFANKISDFQRAFE